MPDRPRLVRAVDPGAVEDPHPARLDRVVRPRWDHLPGERAGPGALRHVPGRVDRLVLDVVDPGRGFEPGLADRDRVDVHQPQVLVEPQLERGPVDDDVRRVAVPELAGTEVRGGDHGGHVQDA